MEKAKILVIDDDPVCIGVLLSLLAERYEVTAANSGTTALELLSVMRPNIVLLDITMPNINGYQVIRQLKSDTATADIPVIVISSLTEASDQEFAFKLGATDYLPKPIMPNAIYGLLDKYLSH
ncbi:response regulator [Shewanella zhangzhouensis]|uniref:response regulator n=1 Tax=Shewanella zhangzhouensis TaxID=2864213 RepID=UPI001C6583C5|nr:response regulator [Shewanella zhangzhouensis]QYK05557.1 response regulator [Shewanella zhangzhouensis]